MMAVVGTYFFERLFLLEQRNDGCESFVNGSDAINSGL